MDWQPIEDLPEGSFRFVGWIHPDDRNSNDQAYVEYERIGKEYRRIDDGRPCGDPSFFILLEPPESDLPDSVICRYLGSGKWWLNSITKPS